MKRLNQRHETNFKGKNGYRGVSTPEDFLLSLKKERSKFLAPRWRRQGREERCLVRQSATRNRACACRRKITASTHNLQAMAVDGTIAWRPLDVLNSYDRLGCDIIGLR